MDPKTVRTGTQTPTPLWRMHLPTAEAARTIPIPVISSSESHKGTWPQYQRSTPGSDSFLNRASDRVLGGIARIGAWAERSIPNDDMLDAAVSLPGSVASTQVNLNDAKQISSRAEAITSYMDDFHPSRLTGVVAKAGAAVDTVTGLLDVAKAVKHDRDVGDRLYSRTLKASVVSTTSMTLGAAAGMGAGVLLAGLSASVAAPVIVGGLIGTGVAYGVKELLNLF